MCKISDLIVLVIEPTDEYLDETCKKLKDLGLTQILCAKTYIDAKEILESSQKIDVVFADFKIDNLYPTGLFLCQTTKFYRPDLVFVLSSRESDVSFMCQSLYAKADDFVFKSDEDELKNKLPYWINVAIARNNFKELLHGKRD